MVHPVAIHLRRGGGTRRDGAGTDATASGGNHWRSRWRSADAPTRHPLEPGIRSRIVVSRQPVGWPARGWHGPTAEGTTSAISRRLVDDGSGHPRPPVSGLWPRVWSVVAKIADDSYLGGVGRVAHAVALDGGSVQLDGRRQQ